MVIFGKCGCGAGVEVRFHTVLQLDVVQDNATTPGPSEVLYALPNFPADGGAITGLRYRVGWPASSPKNYFAAPEFTVAVRQSNIETQPILFGGSAGYDYVYSLGAKGYWGARLPGPVNTLPLPFQAGIGYSDPSYWIVNDFSANPTEPLGGHPPAWDDYPARIKQHNIGDPGVLEYERVCFVYQRPLLTLLSFHGEDFLCLPETRISIWDANACDAASTIDNWDIQTTQLILNENNAAWDADVETRTRLLIEAEPISNL